MSVENPEVMEKYDAVVKRIRELGLRVEISLEYARGDRKADMQGKRFQNFLDPAVNACAQLAARYHPDYLTPVHEPVTMDARMGIRAGPNAWAFYLKSAIRAASPNTLVGAGGWYGGLPYYQGFFAAMPNLDFMGIDIYQLKNLDTYDRTVQLDAKWMKGLVLYASTHGVEAVTPHIQSDILRIRNLGAGSANRSRIRPLKVIQALSATGIWETECRLVQLAAQQSVSA